MTGHHIYTSSWFKYGSNSKNPGTYTVELTKDIFGDNTEDVIYKLNQMCATVPEVLTPRNTDESVMRIYHVLPDTTVVSRSWFVTDEITGRGTVPYTYSLIFRGGDNDRFLKFPAKSFDVSSAESYKSYLERVNSDVPTLLSTKYDPRGEDYKEPYIFSKNDWINNFGFDERLFSEFYISLCRAVCGKGNTRVAVILRKNMYSEKLILATLSLLPLFMKRKFAAVSKWTGMMDGSGSTALNGIQLLCYFDDSPISESGFAVIDLTGARKHMNIEGPTDTELSYAKWVWHNIDENKTLSEFEKFIETSFSAVLDRIPLVVVANSFFLWLNRDDDSHRTAKSSLMLIADSFAKNFSKYEFIEKTLDKVIGRLIEKVDVSDYDCTRVQAVCALATNGSAMAKRLVDVLFDVLKAGECWDRLAVVLQYYKTIFETDISTLVFKLQSCLDLGEKGRECSRIAYETLYVYCQSQRDIILTGKEKSNITRYKTVVKSLNRASKLPDAFFRLKEISKVDSIDTDRFFELENYDIKELEYIPTTQHWVNAIDWAVNLTTEQRRELWILYYSKIKNNKDEYIVALEKAVIVEGNGQNQILAELIRSSDDTKREIADYYKEKFSQNWDGAPRSLDSNDTWRYINAWMARLQKVPLEGQGLQQYLCEKIGLTKDNVDTLAGYLSNESIQTVSVLYKDVESLKAKLKGIMEVDSKAANGDKFFGNIPKEIRNGSKPSLCIDRMLYCYSKNPNAPKEWAFEIAFARSTNERFNVSCYLELRCGEQGFTAGKAEELTTLFEIVKIVLDVESPYKSEADIIFSSIRSRMGSLDHECFKADKAQKTFQKLPDSAWKDKFGNLIINILEDDKNVTDDILGAYRTKYSKASTENDDNLPDHITLGLLTGLLLLIAGIAEIFLFVFGGGNEMISAVLGNFMALILPYVLIVLIVVATLFSALRILRNGGN